MNKLRCFSVLIPLLLWLTACSRVDSQLGREPAAAAEVAELKAAGASSSSRQESTLAYEHTVTVELRKDLLRARVRRLQDACNADREHGCIVLDVEDSSGDRPHGSVGLRLAPGGVDSIIAIASQDGRVTRRATHAEDLAEPVADTARELALLTTHRNRLEELLKTKGIGVDDLITLSKELAGAQTQIDTLNTRAANLRRRIDTELLTITLSVPPQDYDSVQTPIADALQSFGANFQRAIAGVIEFLAVLLPWLVVIIPSITLFRLFWRRIGRWLAAREARSAATK